MMNYVLGSTEPSVAVAFVALMGGFTIIVTSLVLHRRTRLEIDHDFELKKIEYKLNNEEKDRRVKLERDVQLGSIASKREIEFKRIEQEGVINVTGGKRRPVEDIEN